MATKNMSALDAFSMPLKGGWSWNETTNQLEYSSGVSADRQSDRKAKDKRGQARGAGGLHGHFQDGGAMKKQMDQRGGTPGSRAFGRQLATGGGQRGQGKRGKHAGERTHITVEDVKEVSLNRLSEMETVSEAFEALAITPQFDEFLMYLLNYFHWFFEKRAQDTKPNPMNIEPSRAEIQLYDELCDKLESARKQLGRAYCVLILGIGLHDHHHMSCGQSRVSSTYKDRLMYETMYSFLTFLVWISFKRKEFDVVKREIGRILRTDTFNPAIRVKMAEAPSKEAQEETDSKEKEEKKKLTPAEYRRLHGKRPPIKSIINQRSLVLVSIMPDPREEADWLFRRSGALSPTALSNIAREDLDDSGPSYSHLDIDVSKLKVGIIGEPCSQFNPITLTPLGVDTEEDEDPERAEREATEKAKAARRDSIPKQAISRQATAISTVTTDAHLSDED